MPATFSQLEAEITQAMRTLAELRKGSSSRRLDIVRDALACALRHADSEARLRFSAEHPFAWSPQDVREVGR